LAENRQYNASIISLGCDKNRVDTERMMYQLKVAGYSFVESLEDAHLIVVNSCAFINSARKESIETILDLSRHKQESVCQKLVVTGCMPQKYAETDLKDNLPEVDAFLGVGAYDRIGSIVDRLYRGERVIDLEDRDVPIINTQRYITTPQHYAYLKISEGCNYRCTFCTIPSIRGLLKSRDMQSLVQETTELVHKGARELILVAQDLTSYGIDLRQGYQLCALIEQLSKINDLRWIRLMYCYPDLVSDQLIDIIAHNPKVAKYIDIPLQHVNDRLLKLMGRHITKDKTATLIAKIRAANNQIAIRTTFITAFPSETEAEHQEMCQFVRDNRLDHVGFFAFSREKGTPSHDLDGQLPHKVKMQRLNNLGKVHLANAMVKNATRVGSTIEVLYEGIDYDRQLLYGRTQQDAPDIDSLVYFEGAGADVGNIYNVRVTGYDQYDLLGIMEQ
jgi:ribosomal protein S12 methylthiotransferase